MQSRRSHRQVDFKEADAVIEWKTLYLAEARNKDGVKGRIYVVIMMI